MKGERSFGRYNLRMLSVDHSDDADGNIEDALGVAVERHRCDVAPDGAAAR